MVLSPNELVVSVFRCSFLVDLRRVRRSIGRYPQPRIRRDCMAGESQTLDNLVVLSSGVH